MFPRCQRKIRLRVKGTPADTRGCSTDINGIAISPRSSSRCGCSTPILSSALEQSAVASATITADQVRTVKVSIRIFADRIIDFIFPPTKGLEADHTDEASSVSGAKLDGKIHVSSHNRNDARSRFSAVCAEICGKFLATSPLCR